LALVALQARSVILPVQLELPTVRVEVAACAIVLLAAREAGSVAREGTGFLVGLRNFQQRRRRVALFAFQAVVWSGKFKSCGSVISRGVRSASDTETDMIEKVAG